MVEKYPEVIEFADIDISNPKILDRPCNRLRRCPVIVTLCKYLFLMSKYIMFNLFFLSLRFIIHYRFSFIINII